MRIDDKILIDLTNIVRSERGHIRLTEKIVDGNTFEYEISLHMVDKLLYLSYIERSLRGGEQTMDNDDPANYYSDGFLADVYGLVMLGKYI